MFYLDGIPVDLGMRKEAGAYKRLLARASKFFPNDPRSATLAANSTYARSTVRALDKLQQSRIKRATKNYFKNPNSSTANAVRRAVDNTPSIRGYHSQATGKVNRGGRSYIYPAKSNIEGDSMSLNHAKRIPKEVLRWGYDYAPIDDNILGASPFKHIDPTLLPGTRIKR